MTSHNWGPEQWAEYIVESHGGTVASIVETGKRWSEFKAEVHSDKQTGWAEKVTELTGYKQWTADAHIRIHNKFSAIVTRFSELPSSWGSLAELAKLDTDQIEILMDTGYISRDATRADVIFAVKRTKEIAKDIRKKFGDDWVEQLNDYIMEYGLRTTAIGGEDKVLEEEDTIPDEEPEDAGEDPTAPDEDPRVTTVRDMQRGYMMWVDNTEKPFEEPTARRMAEGFVRELAHRLGLTVVDKAA